MKTLYIAATALQLIAVLNIRVNMNGKKGDLIIHEKSVLNSHCIKKRIVEKDLFDRIFLFKDYDSRLNTIFTGRNSFCDYLKLIYQKHFSKLDINDYILEDEKIALEEYDEAFCFNKKFLSILEAYPNIKINLIYDGVGSYNEGVRKFCRKVDKIYLYKPEFAVYYEEYQNKFRAIPALDAKNDDFKKLLNYVWPYNDIIEVPNDTIVVFDSPWRVTPQYFYLFPKFFREKVLVKTKLYKKYANDEKAKEFFVNSIKVIQGDSKNVIVKMHPRSSDVIRQLYLDKGFNVLKNASIPWEIISLNLQSNNILLVSMLSTVSLSMSMYFRNTNFIYKSVFLYELALRVANVKSPEETIRLLGRILPEVEDLKVIKNDEELREL